MLFYPQSRAAVEKQGEQNGGGWEAYLLVDSHKREDRRIWMPRLSAAGSRTWHLKTAAG